MKRGLLSGLLLMVIMTMMIHRVVPHHHHEGIFIQDHEIPLHGQECPNSGEHHPVPCTLQTIDITPPRFLNSDQEALSAGAAPFVAVLAIPPSLAIFEEPFLHTLFQPVLPHEEGFAGNLSARAPPC